MTTFLTLFLVAFGAATLLPFYSELWVGKLVLDGESPSAIWLWATAGNTLGSVVNYGIARYTLLYENRRWFPAKPERLHRAQQWFNKYGQWSLLFAWAPIGGDALTFVGGFMKVPLAIFIVLVGIGKGLRYAALIVALT